MAGTRTALEAMVAMGALALVAACSAGSGAADAPAPSVELSFSQLSIQVGTNEGLLRVVNTGRSDLPVTGVGLDWPGYGDRFLESKSTTLRPGQTVDFPVTLPEPDCADGDDEVRGVVEVNGSLLGQELMEPGQVLLRRIWRRACSEVFVLGRVTIEYDERWRTTGPGRRAGVVGDLRLTRRSGDEPISLLSAQGSVLYDLELPGTTTLPAGERSGRVPLLVVPGNRCVEHARSQATAPFAFRLTLRIGEELKRLPLVPPAEVQAQVTALLEQACG
jgi:hypothetical protein